MALKIYLAGPDVFLPDAIEVGRRKRELCEEYGFEGLFPIDTGSAKDDAVEIFRANCALMRRADVGLLNLTPFRGPSADAGTVFELGHLFALGKPAFGYSSDEKVARECGPLIERDELWWDRGGYLVEDFALFDNLMIARAIAEAGGTVTMIPEEGEGSLAAFRAFEASLEGLRSRFG
jgi:nucleoside 2-deoxyribosyltransferase